MHASHLSKVVLVGLVLALPACASAPKNINNVCSVFDQRDGWFANWHSASQRASSKHGIAVPVLMATLRKESGFKPRARPPRTKLLGFIPWKRQSSAYGYSQALDGTWADYVAETRNWRASRTNFADAVDFVGLVPRQVRRHAGDLARRRLQPLSRLLSRARRLQPRRVARQSRPAALRERDRPDGGALRAAAAGLPVESPSGRSAPPARQGWHGRKVDSRTHVIATPIQPLGEKFDRLIKILDVVAFPSKT
jgi:hypothetical protein